LAAFAAHLKADVQWRRIHFFRDNIAVIGGLLLVMAK